MKIQKEKAKSTSYSDIILEEMAKKVAELEERYDVFIGYNVDEISRIN